MPKREYVLTNGSKFIKQDIDGKYKQTTSIGLADSWESIEAAENVMFNSLPKSLSRSYYVAEINDGKILQCNVPRLPKTNKKTGEKSFIFDDDFTDTKWCKSFAGLDSLFDDAAKRSRNVGQELSDTEAQNLDLEHYIEFCPLNARDGYKIYRKLRELLKKRRHLKDEQRVINAINKNRLASEHIKDILVAIESCKGREYKPRVLPGLFEEGVEFFDKPTK